MNSLSEEDLANLTPEEKAEFDALLAAGCPKGEHQAEWDRCKDDPAYWIDTYCWTYNPKLPPKERWLRFKLFPRQFELIEFLQAREAKQESGLVEKSREVGVSWIVMAYMAHHWLFEEGFKGGAGSRVENYVDKLGDPDSLFEKVRLLLGRLPEWQLPAGFDSKKHCGFMKFVNPENGSVLTGESGDNIGRGGRNSFYFVDESAFIEHQDKVEAALSHNADCIIDGSTVNGIGNSFYKKRFSGAIPVFIFDWRDDPRKTQDWYDAIKAKYAHNPALLASEVDRDYSASVLGILIQGKWVQAAINACNKIPGLLPSGQVVAASDIAAGGANLTVFGRRTGPVVDVLTSWSEENTTVNAFRLADATKEAKATLLNYDANGIGIACKSTWALEKDASGKSTLGFKTNGILGGASPTESVWPDGNTSKELFYNYRAEIAWVLKERFRKTYEVVMGVAEHPVEELISIPFHGELVAQLSIPIAKKTGTGKNIVESKEDMKKRGIDSPDWFDMMMYLFAPEIISNHANAMAALEALKNRNQPKAS